ncbi:hypothetical protein [Paenibacillus oryzisoli]|uniref:hypothetical protein n=1 Tax=Paenibacillus oryzisoli TaxID=1850517 RepID=UPI0012FBFFE4|nr:hypothetical protein [Paenibacillus oryzisoli]
MKAVKYIESAMEYVNGDPVMVNKEWDAMLEGVQGDGSAIIYIDTIPYRVTANKIKGIS